MSHRAAHPARAEMSYGAVGLAGRGQTFHDPGCNVVPSAFLSGSRWAWFTATLLASAAFGCGDEKGSRPAPLDQEMAQPVVGSGSAGEYPEGPYARDNPVVGDVIENLTLLGYLGSPGRQTSTGGTLDELSLGDLRGDEARYLLLHTSAVWCATCQVEAKALSKYGAAIAEAGGVAIELLIDGQAPGAEPVKRELEIWVEVLDLAVTTMGPGDDNVQKVFPERAHVYIVDLETMEVVWHAHGPQNGQTPTEAGALVMLEQFLID